VCSRLIDCIFQVDCYTVFIIVIVFPYFRLLYILQTLHLYSHHTCGVWMNFPKTIRTNKIVMWATMLFICTTKTIVGLPVFLKQISFICNNCNGHGKTTESLPEHVQMVLELIHRRNIQVVVTDSTPSPHGDWRKNSGYQEWLVASTVSYCDPSSCICTMTA